MPSSFTEHGPSATAPQPRPRSAWQSLVNASARALRKTIADDLDAETSLRALDARMAKAIRVNDTALFDAALKTAASLLSNKPNAQPWVPIALTEAVDQSDFYALHQLIAFGASPDSSTASIEKPVGDFNDRLLHRAVSKRLPEMAKALISHGASVDIQSALPAQSGDTPLMLAAELGFADMVKTLTQAGANVNCLNQEGQSALDKALPYAIERKTTDYTFHRLHFSAPQTASEIALHLLESGANAGSTPTPSLIFSDSSASLPPLAAAIGLNDAPLIKALIKAGADASWLFEPLTPTPDAPSIRSDPRKTWLQLVRHEAGPDSVLELSIQLAQTVAQNNASKTLDRLTPSRRLDATPSPSPGDADSGDIGQLALSISILPPSAPPDRHILAARRAAKRPSAPSLPQSGISP